MKIDSKLIPLNQESPSWNIIQDFLSSSRLQNNLLKFLDNYAVYLPENFEIDNIAIHALRILAYVQDERVLPYIVEFLSHAQTPFQKDVHNFENKRNNIYDSFEDEDVSNLGYCDDIIVACKQALELLAMNKKFLDTFWILYKVTLSKDVAHEYLSAAILCDLNKCGREVADRIGFTLQPKLQKALYKDFSIDPFFGAHHALLTLDTNFLPLLENVISLQLRDFKQNVKDYENEDFLVFWGQIPLTWFILKEIQRENYEDIYEHIKLFIFDDPIANFHAYYQKVEDEELLQSEIDPQKDGLFRQRLKEEIINYFNPLEFQPKSKKKPVYKNNIIPLFR